MTVVHTFTQLHDEPIDHNGSLGWPLIGETPDFLRAGQNGEPHKFIRERMDKHDSRVFKTSLLGEPMAVFCGQETSSCLATRISWSPLVTATGDEAKRMRRMLMTFLNPDALRSYVERMEIVTQQHISTHWDGSRTKSLLYYNRVNYKGKEEVRVFPIVKLYTFELACRLFTSIDDPSHISKLAAQFNVFLKGVIDLPINLPGTTFYHAMRAANAIREELQVIATQRRVDLEEKKASPKQDLLSHLLATADASGKFLTEMEIIDNILLLLFAGHDTTRSAITLLMRYLGDLPQVYEKVLKEQIDIAMSKEPGELLQWEDIQKMRYSWSVVSEVMRLSPPASGAFREALTDITYAGYTIPRGWKLYWSTGSTQRDQTFFQNPEEFDASRFEGAGPTSYSYVPFGGGPRMCPGQEFARLQILVFLHNMVKRFRWDLLIPDENFGYNPMLAPSKGLPIRLRPHKFEA
ncbi:hypothetical protein L1049_019071 [Liquidambar formosana]|uniref:Cytochrome P450 n=1 Tax=Liquidambar formosana TaxID=63359 RepID=A0AAP0RAZ9_LIQFO